MGRFFFTNGGGLSVASGPSTTSKANSNLTGFLDAPDPVYGSGADGSATLDGSATVLSMAPSSSVYTATRDLFFYNLIISDSVRLNPAGYRIFVQNVLTLGNDSIIALIGVIPIPPAISRNARTGIWFVLTPTLAIASMTSGTFFNFETARVLKLTGAKRRATPETIESTKTWIRFTP